MLVRAHVKQQLQRKWLRSQPGVQVLLAGNLSALGAGWILVRRNVRLVRQLQLRPLPLLPPRLSAVCLSAPAEATPMLR